MGRAVLAVVSAFALAAVLGGCTGDPAPANPSDVRTLSALPAAQRQPAPELFGELVDGRQFDPAGQWGRVVVVNFWGSWCAPCVAEADDLEATYQATKDQGVSFVGVNVRDTRGRATAFAAENSTYPSIFDPASRLVLGFSVPPTAIPSTVVIDRQGRVAVVVNRPVVRSELEPVVAEVAAEPA